MKKLWFSLQFHLSEQSCFQTAYTYHSFLTGNRVEMLQHGGHTHAYFQLGQPHANTVSGAQAKGHEAEGMTLCTCFRCVSVMCKRSFFLSSKIVVDYSNEDYARKGIWDINTHVSCETPVCSKSRIRIVTCCQGKLMYVFEQNANPPSPPPPPPPPPPHKIVSGLQRQTE